MARSLLLELQPALLPIAGVPLLLIQGNGSSGCFVPGQVLGQCLIDKVRFGLAGANAPICQII